MRPAHVYANLSDEQYHDLVTALHQQWRVATRAVMVLLSAGGMPATDIGALLHYDPRTVRRWIARHDLQGVTGLRDRPCTGRPGWAALAWASGSVPCWPRRKRGPPAVSGVSWAAQRSACAPCTGVCENRPAGAGPA
jgi:hypothetical protein